MSSVHTSFFNSHGSLYRTVVNRSSVGLYEVRQDNPVNEPFYSGEETILLERTQAVALAKAILKKEGIKCD